MLDLLTQRSVVVSMAVAGAALVMLSNLLLSTGKITRPVDKVVTVAGYTITGISILLFIVAGFRVS